MSMQLRNLYAEFMSDKRMFPSEKTHRGLGDDWTFERQIPTHLCTIHAIAPQLSRIHFHFIADGPHRYSKFARPGRILYISIPEHSKAQREILRSIPFGEAWDFVRLISDEQFAALVSMMFSTLPTEEEFIANEFKLQQAALRLEQIKHQEQLACREGGSFQVIDGILKFMPAAAIMKATQETIEREEAKLHKASVFAIRGSIREAFTITDDELQAEMLTFIEQTVLENGPSHAYQEALQQELKSLQIKLEAQQQKLADKLAGVKPVVTPRQKKIKPQHVKHDDVMRLVDDFTEHTSKGVIQFFDTRKKEWITQPGEITEENLSDIVTIMGRDATKRRLMYRTLGRENHVIFTLV